MNYTKATDSRTSADLLTIDGSSQEPEEPIPPGSGPHRSSMVMLDGLPEPLRIYFENVKDEALLPDGKLKIVDTYGAALAHKHLAGCNVIPTGCSTKWQKRPIRSWKRYETEMMSDDEIRENWLDQCHGIAVICGKVSGDLEVLDVENDAIWQRLREKIMADRGEAFLARFYITKTPKSGRHVYYRCPGHIEGAKKLAAKIDGENFELLIETRGEGNYALAVGSPSSAHPSGRRYEIEQLTPEDIPVISPEDRSYLLDAARSFDERPKRELTTIGESSPTSGPRPKVPPDPDTVGGRPGDDFNERATWEAILEPAGWQIHHVDGCTTYWTRPGKDPSTGHSASTGHGGDCFYVFSSAAHPFEPCTGYSKFSTYALLHHSGNFAAAAKQLWNDGYGARPKALTWEDVTPEEDPSDDPELGDEKGKPMSVSQQRQYLLKVVEAECEIFHDQFATPMATIQRDRRTVCLESPDFEAWLDRFYKVKTGRYPSPEVAPAVSTTLSRQALAGKTETVYSRYATVSRNGEISIYVNLMNNGKYVEITASGVSIITNPPVKMRKVDPMSLSLPLPDLDAVPGDLLLLKQVINVKDEDDLWLIVGYIVGCITSEGPFPILIVTGEQGSAKSTVIELIRSILDPNEIDHIEMPANVLDLRAVVKAHSVLSLDNVSRLNRQDADRLCRIATGGGIVSRSLYTNDELSALKVQRPILLNSIPKMAEHGDLVDRCLSVSLPAIDGSEKGRKNKNTEILPAFHKMLPRLLGAFYKAVSASLASECHCTTNVRMIEFVQRVGAAESALPWQAGQFERLVAENRSGSLEDAAEMDPIAAAIIEVASSHTRAAPWQGSWKLLLAEIRQRCNRPPETERGLQSAVARLAPILRSRKVTVERTGRDKSATLIHVFADLRDGGSALPMSLPRPGGPAPAGVAEPDAHKGDLDDFDSWYNSIN